MVFWWGEVNNIRTVSGKRSLTKKQWRMKYLDHSLELATDNFFHIQILLCHQAQLFPPQKKWRLNHCTKEARLSVSNQNRKGYFLPRLLSVSKLCTAKGKELRWRRRLRRCKVEGGRKRLSREALAWLRAPLFCQSLLPCFVSPY